MKIYRWISNLQSDAAYQSAEGLEGIKLEPLSNGMVSVSFSEDMKSDTSNIFWSRYRNLTQTEINGLTFYKASSNSYNQL